MTPEAKKPARIDWKRSFDEAEEKRHKAERQLATVTAERDALRVDADKCKPLTAWMDNVLASKLGKVALAAGARTDGMAESIDFGLRLRRLLEESGFEVRVAAIDAARGAQ